VVLEISIPSMIQCFLSSRELWNMHGRMTLVTLGGVRHDLGEYSTLRPAHIYVEEALEMIRHMYGEKHMPQHLECFFDIYARAATYSPRS
jgi:hypothetical protein